MKTCAHSWTAETAGKMHTADILFEIVFSISKHRYAGKKGVIPKMV